MKDENVEKVNAGTEIVNIASGLLAEISPVFLGIPIVSFAINRVVGFTSEKNIVNRLKKIEKKLLDKRITIEEFREKVFQLSEHNEYIVKNNLNNLKFNDYSYGLSIYYGAQPKGKYDKYDFIRYLLEISYEFPETTDNKDDLYAFSYSVEFIKVDNNYYISGTEMDEFFSDLQESIYELFEKYQGDVSKFTLDDVYKYMEEKNG